MSTLTLAEAGYLSDILRAAERKAAVARVFPGGGITIGQAQYIGTAGGRDCRAESRADVRDLFLAVKVTMTRGSNAGELAHWPVRFLMREVPTGHFVPDFDQAAYDAAMEAGPEPGLHVPLASYLA